MNVFRWQNGVAVFVVAVALAEGMIGVAHSQTVLIDFGNDDSFRGATIHNPDANGSYWTSMRTGVFYQDLVDFHNTPTTIDFGFSTGVGTDSYNGPAGPTAPVNGLPETNDPHFFVPFTQVNQAALGLLGGDLAGPFDFVAGPGVIGHNQVRFEIQQLDPAKKYTLTFFGSHKFSDDATTVYSVYSDNTYTTQVGTANLNVQNPANNSEHNQDTVATISNLSPQADNILYVQFVGLNGGQGYLNDMMITAATPVLNGDYNLDGRVNVADYTEWRKFVGTNQVLPNDPTGGTIGNAQYFTWRSNFGTGAPGAGGGLESGGPVPEPGTLLLGILGAMALIAFRRS